MSLLNLYTTSEGVDCRRIDVVGERFDVMLSRGSAGADLMNRYGVGGWARWLHPRPVGGAKGVLEGWWIF